MSYPNNLAFRSIIVAKDASLSPVLSLNAGERLIGFVTPAAIEATTARITFTAAMTAAGTFYPVYQDGTLVAQTFAVSEYNLFAAPAQLYGVRHVKIQLETAAGVAVAQATAARTFYAIVEVM